jgi:glycosyltransferase involved in cell wall biosynthesis
MEAGATLSRPRVAVLDHVVECGGAQLAIARLADQLAREVEFQFVLPGPGPFQERLEAAGHRVHLVPLGSAREMQIGGIRPVADLAAHGPELFVAAARIGGLLRDLEVAVLYSNSLKAHVYGALAARVAGVPQVVHFRDILMPPYLPLRLRRALQAFFLTFPPAAAVANSEATARVAPIRGECTVIPSGITHPPAPVSHHRDGSAVLAVLGRLERWKGQDVAIRALARLRRRRPDARLLIGGATEVGEAAFAQELRELTEVLGIGEAIEFTGFVDDPYRFFARADVAVHSSVLPEPFGQVVVEAMAVGRPVIATAAGGPLEILQRGRYGVLVPPSDPDAIADAAARVLDSPSLYGRLADASVRRAGDYTIEASAASTLALLREVAAR